MKIILNSIKFISIEILIFMSMLKPITSMKHFGKFYTLFSGHLKAAEFALDPNSLKH